MEDVGKVKEASIFNRDQVLSQMDSLFQIQDEGERSNKIAQFIDERLKLLAENSVPREFSLLARPRKGFLHPDSGIRRSFLVDPFHVDDPEIV